MRRWLTALVLLTGCTERLDFGAYCDPGAPMADLYVTAPDPAENLSCPKQNWGGLSTRVMSPAGESDVPQLTIDSRTRTTQGFAGQVPAGDDLPVMVVISQSNFPLVVWVESADLRGRACGEEVTLDVTQAPAWYQPEQMVQARDLSPQTPLEAAQRWASRAFSEYFAPLDEDADGCPNLSEACLGVLGRAEHQEPCP